MFWRNPTAAFFNFLLPLVFLGLFGSIFAGDRENLEIIVPGIAGMSVMATTFSALAFNMTFLREQGVLKRIRGTPLPVGSYLGGLVASAVTNATIQIAFVTIAGAAVFGVGWPADWPALLLFAALGVACFATLGIALSHAIPSFDAAAAYVNAIFLPAIAISGVFYDVADAPALLKDVAEVLPLKHVIDGLSGAMVTGAGVGSNVTAVAVIGVWALAGLALAVRGWSWEQRRD